MKVLTLTQPWATLVAIGAKKIETRSWYTAYRGPLAIHAAKGFPRSARDFHYAMVAEQYGIPIENLPLGQIIATTRLTDCRLIVNDSRALRPSRMLPPVEPEFSFGDYSEDRYGWLLSDVVALTSPIPAKGALSLWEFDIHGT